MKLVRDKVFDSFLEGKEEILNFLPMYTPSFFELANSNTINDCDSNLGKHDVTIEVEHVEHGYRFKLTFITEDYMYIQKLFTFRGWSVLEDECRCISQKDIYEILKY